MDMEERRKSKRIDLTSKLLVKRLDSDVRDEVDVEITDVSKTGIGFCCKTLLDMGAVYEARLTIWTKEVLHAFIEIVRIQKEGDIYEYGGLFIGMTEMELQRISVYSTVEEELGRG